MASWLHKSSSPCVLCSSSCLHSVHTVSSLLPAACLWCEQTAHGPAMPWDGASDGWGHSVPDNLTLGISLLSLKLPCALPCSGRFIPRCSGLSSALGLRRAAPESASLPIQSVHLYIYYLICYRVQFKVTVKNRNVYLVFLIHCELCAMFSVTEEWIAINKKQSDKSFKGYIPGFIENNTKDRHVLEYRSIYVPLTVCSSDVFSHNKTQWKRFRLSSWELPQLTCYLHVSDRSH